MSTKTPDSEAMPDIVTFGAYHHSRLGRPTPVRFNAFHHAGLGFLADCLEGASISTALRFAIEYMIRTHPNAGTEKFRRFVHDQVLSETEDEEIREEIEAGLERIETKVDSLMQPPSLQPEHTKDAFGPRLDSNQLSFSDRLGTEDTTFELPADSLAEEID